MTVRIPSTGSRRDGRHVGRAALAVLLLTGPLATPGRAVPQQRVPERPSVLSWPEPPAPARIQFVRVLRPSAAGVRRSGLSRFFRMITGAGSEVPEMAQPYGIATDDAGRVFVGDTYAGKIHVFDVRENRYSSIDVKARALIGVAVLADTLVITDSEGQRVTRVTMKGKTIWTIGRDAGFERPTGIVAAGDRLHVVDTMAARVVTVSDKGEILGSFGSRGGGRGQFNFPTNIARAADGRLFVTDSMNFRVQVFAPDGGFLGMFGRLGDGSGDFNKPKGIGIDGDGHVYVVEGLHDTVQIFDDAGRFLLAFGESGAAEGQFWLPTGLAIRDDFIYVADSSNRRVQMFRYLKESP
jgi:DNA-binding beta-propeller fold protein YncE